MQHGFVHLFNGVHESQSHKPQEREKNIKEGIGGKDEERKKRFQGIDGEVRRK